MHKFKRPQKAAGKAMKCASLLAFAGFAFVLRVAPYALNSTSKDCRSGQSGSPGAARAGEVQETSPDDNTATAAWRARNSLAIIYLTKRTEAGLSNLEKSLQLVHQHVLPWTAADVLVFYEGDFSSEDQAQLSANRPHVHFLGIPPRFWRLPDFLREEDSSSWHDESFSIGYRHMIRWFSLHLWTFAEEAGYQWVMRLDEESYIHSPIQYNLTQFMQDRDIDYAYRLSFTEWPTSATGFPEMLRAYLEMVPEAQAEAGQLLQQCSPASLEGLTGAGWSRFAYYNNFFLTSVAFWQRRDVRQLLGLLDRTGGIYTRRWGDALVHTAAVQMFLPEGKVHKFEDWTYEHATLGPAGQLTWGGIVGGSDDPDREQRVAEFRAAHGGQAVLCIEESKCA